MTDYTVILNETLGISDKIATKTDYHITLNETLSIADKVDFTFIVQIFDSVLTLVGLK